MKFKLDCAPHGEARVLQWGIYASTTRRKSGIFAGIKRLKQKGVWA